MKKIPSFTVNHLSLLRGIYVSRKDAFEEDGVNADTNRHADVHADTHSDAQSNTQTAESRHCVTTFDIRMKEPNREPVMDIAALHTIEHLGATYLRNNAQWKDRIVYFGPMGCRTGCYLLLKGNLESRDIVDLVKSLFEFMANFSGDVPGAAARDCGNYLNHDLPMARWESEKFYNEVLLHLREGNLRYPE